MSENASVDQVISSVSGVRGIVGRGLTPELACAFAAALGTAADGGAPGPIVLCRDGRPSGTMLRHAVLAGLMSTGRDVIDIEIAPTPTCGFAVAKLKAAGGLMITASHNPAPWNGLKLFGPDGNVLTADEGMTIQAVFEAGRFTRAVWDMLGAVRVERHAEDWHRDRVLQLVDVVRIRAAQLTTFLDANGGAGGPLGRQLLNAFQTHPVCQAADADGVFVHEPEPTRENLVDVCPLVAKHGADVGFVLDPDADRLALIDENGHYLGEELTLALAVKFRLMQERGPVVINLSTSRMVEDIARQFEDPCLRAPVGEANVVAMMREVGALIGGEGNGGIIDPRVGWVRDPFIGMALILSYLAESGKPISQLAAELPAYQIVKTKYPADRARLPGLIEALQKRWPEAASDVRDGLRLDWPDRWVQVRPSNTEPIVRVIAEAPKVAEAKALCDEVGALLRSEDS